jgi:hypothetical protein
MKLRRPVCRWKDNCKRKLMEIDFDDTGFVWLSVGSKYVCLQTR